MAKAKIKKGDDVNLAVNNLFYRYQGAKKVVLKGLSYDFKKNRVYTIIGKSGSGKTTFLSLIAGLDNPSKGEIIINGRNLKDYNLDDYRAQEIGVVFQAYNLLTNTTAIDNIVLSMNISGSEVKDKRQYAIDKLAELGIDEETAERKVLELSGGEQQRVCIARALSHDPSVIIADEPTGNLDEETEGEILEIFENLAKKHGKCVIIVTHSPRVTKIADEIIKIQQGEIVATKIID